MRSFVVNIAKRNKLIIGMPLEVEHVVPEVNGGRTDESNLCLACSRCNRHKSSRTEAIDRLTDTTVPLFHPRQQHGYEHFVWQNGGVQLVGQTPIGRATIDALQINNRFVVRSRKLWISQGWHPPI